MTSGIPQVRALKYKRKICVDFCRNRFSTIGEVFIPEWNIGYNFDGDRDKKTINVFVSDEPLHKHPAAGCEVRVKDSNGKPTGKVEWVADRKEAEALKDPELTEIRVDENLAIRLTKIVELQEEIKQRKNTVIAEIDALD